MRYSERTQVLLSKEQRKDLESLAREKDQSMGALIREAVDTYLLRPRRSRREALDHLFSLNAPVGPWEEMEKEITEGRF